MYVCKLYADSPWAVVPYRLVQGYRYFGECSGFVIRIEVEVPGSSKMLVPIYLSIQHYIPEDQTRNQEVQHGSQYT